MKFLAIFFITLLLVTFALLIIGLAYQEKRKHGVKADYMRQCISQAREDRCEELWRWRDHQ